VLERPRLVSERDEWFDGCKFMWSAREEGTIYRALTCRNEERAYRGCAAASEWVGWF